MYHTRDDRPGFAPVRAVGLALLALGGFLLLPRYPGRTHPAAPPQERPRAPRPAAVAAPVPGPGFVRPAHHKVPLAALPAPGGIGGLI